MTATWRDCAKGLGLCNRLSEPVGGFALIYLCWRKSRFPATETAADGDSVRSCHISARKDPRLMRNDARARGIVDADRRRRHCADDNVVKLGPRHRPGPSARSRLNAALIRARCVQSSHSGWIDYAASNNRQHHGALRSNRRARGRAVETRSINDGCKR